MAPFAVQDMGLGFGEKPGPAQVSLVIRRDYPLTDDERLLLARVLERRLQVPVSLRVELAPFLSPVTFDEKGDPSGESLAAMALVKGLPGGPGAFSFRVEAGGKDGRRHADRLKRYLMEELGVPAANVGVHVRPGSGADTGASVVVVRR